MSTNVDGCVDEHNEELETENNIDKDINLILGEYEDNSPDWHNSGGQISL